MHGSSDVGNCAPAVPAPDTHLPSVGNNTIRKLHSMVSAAFDRAVRYRQLGVNPAELAQPPAFKRGNPDPLSPAEAAALLNTAWADPERGLFLWLSMTTGSRRGEMVALRWRHIDLDRGTLAVQRSVAQTRAGLVEKDTKSSQRYRRMATKLGLRSTRPQALRHYTATELLAAGADLRTVAGRLGHSDGGATTLRIYAGRVAEADRRAAATLAELMPLPKPRSDNLQARMNASPLICVLTCWRAGSGQVNPR